MKIVLASFIGLVMLFGLINAIMQAEFAKQSSAITGTGMIWGRQVVAELDKNGEEIALADRDEVISGKEAVNRMIKQLEAEKEAAPTDAGKAVIDTYIADIKLAVKKIETEAFGMFMTQLMSVWGVLLGAIVIGSAICVATKKQQA
ncbi:MAG: hypothetical protein LBM01_03365 [Christensenellaceae bacterium]|jgi:hypothetical protein|nr:hypothetical protein [Christensenellaceae bacterium]